MTGRARPIIRAALLAAACPAAAEVPALSLVYSCAGETRLRVAYLNVAPDLSLAVIDHEGALVPMQAGPTGSGVRYVALGPGPALVWHTKGDAGTLLGPDGAVLLADCVARAD